MHIDIYLGGNVLLERWAVSFEQKYVMDEDE